MLVGYVGGLWGRHCRGTLELLGGNDRRREREIALLTPPSPLGRLCRPQDKTYTVAVSDVAAQLATAFAP